MQDTCLSNIFIAHAPSGYLWASGKNSYTGIRFLELNFLIKNDMLAIWRCFLLISALDKLNVRRICTSGLTYGPRNVAHASSFTFKLFTNFEVGTTIRCRRSCCWYVTWACGLDRLWPFDLGSGYTWQVIFSTSLSTRFGDPMVICSWIISSDISHSIPLRMRL